MAIVLLGIWASPVHNGGAYGDGTAESGVGFGCGAVRTARRLGQLALSSGRAGASGQDCSVVRFWEDEFVLCRRRFLAHGVPIPQELTAASDTPFQSLML